MTLPFVYYEDCKPFARVEGDRGEMLAVGHDKDSGALVLAEFQSSWSRSGLSDDRYRDDLARFNALPLIVLADLMSLGAMTEEAQFPHEGGAND